MVLANQLPVMWQAANVARRRMFDGEKVPNGDTVSSIFESPTELIKRGRRERPIEFGHKVLLTESKEKFITEYVALEENCHDSSLLPLVNSWYEASP
jgi:urease gamma subunit